MTITRDT